MLNTLKDKRKIQLHPLVMVIAVAFLGMSSCTKSYEPPPRNGSRSGRRVYYGQQQGRHLRKAGRIRHD